MKIGSRQGDGLGENDENCREKIQRTITVIQRTEVSERWISIVPKGKEESPSGPWT